MSIAKSFRLLTFSVVLLSWIFLTSCGGGGNESVTTIDVELADHKFTPAEFTVPAGTEITINLKNSGTQPHEFQIMTLDAMADEKVDKNGISTKYWNAIVYRGENKSLKFISPSEPGSYVIKCSVPGHTEAGMVGAMKVE
jgi:uncharacterized cupredoxin-like copper-binding protein